LTPGELKVTLIQSIMRFTLTTLSLLLAVAATPITKRGGSWGDEGSDSSCIINGISVGDCTNVGVSNILNDLGVSILKRGGGEKPSEKGCLINGISVLDCSSIDIGDILNGLSVRAFSRRDWDEDCGCEKPKPSTSESGCSINGISILDCSSIDVGDILNGLQLRHV